MALRVLIMAAGLGKRMHSSTPKVLHPLAGRPLLAHVLNSVKQLNPEHIHVIYGHGGKQVQRVFAEEKVDWILQEEKLGTGHAVQQTLPHIEKEDKVLILNGDVPLIQSKTLETLMASTPDDALGIITAQVENPLGLGRIVRDEQHHITAIIEEKDANAQQRQIREIYAGMMFAHGHHLQTWLPKLSKDNAQEEYLLTDLVQFALQDKKAIHSTPAGHLEVQGVNTRHQLIMLERTYQQLQARELLFRGVSIMDPMRFDLRGNLTAGSDVTIDINTLFVGNNTIGNQCYIGPGCVLTNVTLGNNVTINAHCTLENTTIADGAVIGPFARLRPGTELAENTRIGNFVETKNAKIGRGSKACHLSYIGDAILGEGVNVGAGTITCNYDGVNKHQTTIEDGAFIGSGTQLIAPMTVEKGAYVAAGSTVTKKAPADSLTLTRAKQRTLSQWTKPQDKKET